MLLCYVIICLYILYYIRNRAMCLCWSGATELRLAFRTNHYRVGTVEHSIICDSIICDLIFWLVFKYAAICNGCFHFCHADVISGSLFVQFLFQRSSLYFSQRFTWLKSTGGHFLFWTDLDGLQSAVLSTWIVYSFMMIKNKKGKKQKRTETKEQKRNEMAKRTGVGAG